MSIGTNRVETKNQIKKRTTREHETDSSLNLARRKSGLFVVSGKLSSLGSDTLEDIVDKRVHDGHSLLRDSSIRMHLLKNLVNVRRIRLGTLLTLLAGGGLLGCLGRLLGWCFGHVEKVVRL